jgi:hypothetical protein
LFSSRPILSFKNREKLRTLFVLSQRLAQGGCMRILYPGVRHGVALSMLLVVIAAPAVYADGNPSPTDPQGRINPPIGLTSQGRINPPGGGASAGARIHPPGGRTKSQARISPPIGATSPEPNWFELLTEWMRAQARIHPPTG